MSAAEFAERLAESAKIIKYTFRMEIPKEEQDLQDNLVACSPVSYTHLTLPTIA